jgi:hypothetical protein
MVKSRRSDRLLPDVNVVRGTFGTCGSPSRLRMLSVASGVTETCDNEARVLPAVGRANRQPPVVSISLRARQQLQLLARAFDGERFLIRHKASARDGRGLLRDEPVVLDDLTQLRQRRRVARLQIQDRQTVVEADAHLSR